MCEETITRTITITSSSNDAKEVFPKLAERAVCINLLERDDRMKAAQGQFAKVGLTETVEFHRVERHPRGGRYGCYNSHREVMQKALNDGIQSLLVFEDDVQFKAGWEKVVIDTKQFFESGTHFDAFFLGTQILFVDEKFTSNIWRIKCSNAHAYIVSRAGMKAFLSNSDKFETEIRLHPQDLTQNSVWQHMYGHGQTDSITQTPLLGTDNLWFPDIPAEYAPWFQIAVLGKFETWVFPLVRQKWYRTSWLGRQYVVGVDQCTIDDGRIRLKSIPVVDMLLVIVFIIFTHPPFGYYAFFRDFVKPAIVSRFGKQKSL